MSPSKTIPYANRNHTGWWIASYVLRYDFLDNRRPKKNQQCLVWENTILVRARHRDEAYKKAVRVAQNAAGGESWVGKKKRKGTFTFAGMTSLLPVYEEIEDGCEIVWSEYRTTVGRLARRVKAKQALEAFDDSPDLPR